jgi:D-glycero-alpha-D-manno-heptose-7-phosphate kinase
MIITRTPLRICLGGGGTDVKDYYSEHGGYVVSAALNQYIYIVIHKHFEKNIRLCYSKREIVQSSDEVRHPVVHEAMKLFAIDGGGFEIISFADIPSDTGLGTSSSFTVGLITALAAYKRVKMTKYEIAEMACLIERELLQEAGGKQDQYIAAFGGITCMIFEPSGKVLVSPVQVSHASVESLEKNILLFYTGIRRNSPKVQQSLIRGVKKATQTLASLHDIKRLGVRTEEILRNGEIDRYGEILRDHWNAKQRLSDAVTNGRINRLYQLGMDHGAIGGKIIGAGGGGYMLFYCPADEARQAVRRVMNEEGLEELLYRFDFTGATVLVGDGVEVKAPAYATI